MLRKTYPSDLNDSEWDCIKDLLPTASRIGSPRTVDLREIINAIFYIDDNGIKWRAMPHDFPPSRTVYYYFEKWSKEGVFEKIHHVISIKARQFEDRKSNPSTVMVDSQSIKASYSGNSVGFDSNKKIKGRKRHIAIDTLGIIIAAIVTAAHIHDSTQFTNLFVQAAQNDRTDRIERVYADSAYESQYNRDFIQKTFQAELIISNKPSGVPGFVPLPQRWKVERTISWLGGYRNLSRDYDSSIQSSESWIWIAAIHQTLKRLPKPSLPTSRGSA